MYEYMLLRMREMDLKFLILGYFSGKDNMVPSGDEAQRLKNLLQNCTVRHFTDNGHTLLLVNYYLTL